MGAQVERGVRVGRPLRRADGGSGPSAGATATAAGSGMTGSAAAAVASEVSLQLLGVLGAGRADDVEQRLGRAHVDHG